MKTITTIYHLEANEASDLLEFIGNQFGIVEVNKITTNDDGDILIYGVNQEDKTQESVDHFVSFASKHNKRMQALELLNEINELSKETGKLALMLQ